MVKNPPAVQETWVQSLGQEDPLEKEMATHSSILTLEISWTEDLGGPQSMGLQISRHNLEIKQQQLQFTHLVISGSLEPTDYSMPGFPILHYLLEFGQTHVHRVGNAIQPSHHLLHSSCPQSFPASGSFPVSQLFT